jgi:hypothetical protein
VDRCDECGFVYGALPVPDIPRSLRAVSARYETRLKEPADALRAHPVPGTWSALEYACHIRDVMQVQRQRLALALVEETPKFTPMRREERVVELRYNEQDPATVATQIREAAAALAEAFAALDDAQWSRTVIYTWPQEFERTLTWVGRHTVHEGEHHALDIDRMLAAARS